MAEDARSLAWEVLRRVDETDAFADAVLGKRLEACRLERRDQAFATQLVYGTLAWRGFLQLGIQSFAGRPAASIEAPIRSLLELALFQLFKLERVPAYAVVNSAVDLAKTHKAGRATGLVNAVLRRASREGVAAVQLPRREDDLAGHLAARESHPRWLVERWLASLGEAATETLLAADNQPAPTVLRANRRRVARDEALAALLAAGATVEPGVGAPAAIRFSGGSALDLAAFAAGEVSLQSEASQLVTHLLEPQPGERILDACAGAGGKSAHIAELQDDRGAVVALDLHRHALARLRGEARRLGLDSIAAVQSDARRAPLSPGLFDRVLLDAPCTGFGTVRQHPEIRWRRRESDVAASARLQVELLSSLLDQVKPGGVLVYAVCTLLREENANVVDAVLARRADVERQDARPHLPEAARAFVDEHGALRTSPAAGGLDGFYAVRLKRR